METFWKIIAGEFFWGIVIGLLLSFIGGWVQATVADRMQRKSRAHLVRDFCIDTITNLKDTIEDMENTREKTKTIYHEFLNLIDAEVQVFGRNRENLVYLPTGIRSDVRKLINDIAIERADISAHLGEAFKFVSLADQIQAAGRAPEADRLRSTRVDPPLAEAQASAEKLASISARSDPLKQRLSEIKMRIWTWRLP